MSCDPLDPALCQGDEAVLGQLARADRRTLIKLFAGAFAAGAGAFQVVEAFGHAGGTGAALAVLGVAEKRFLSALADTILPDTDTPGALRAGVSDFMVRMVEEWLDPADRAGFVQGLSALDRRIAQASGASFESLSPARRLMSLLAVQQEADAARKAGGPVPFFLLLKRLVVYGYYTSEVGASEELTLNLVPGEYQPCAPVDGHVHAFSIQRTWPLFPTGNTPSFS